MIKEFVQAWDSRKSHLEDWFKKTKQQDLSYESILKGIIDNVLNPGIEYGKKWDSENIHTIDDGDYQGSQLFIVPMDTYQPAPYDYFITYQDYGSCTGCDLLESIRRYDSEFPGDTQIKQYMMLALHLLQRCRYIVDNKSYWEEE